MAVIAKDGQRLGFAMSHEALDRLKIRNEDAVKRHILWAEISKLFRLRGSEKPPQWRAAGYAKKCGGFIAGSAFFKRESFPLARLEMKFRSRRRAREREVLMLRGPKGMGCPELLAALGASRG